MAQEVPFPDSVVVTKNQNKLVVDVGGPVNTPYGTANFALYETVVRDEKLKWTLMRVEHQTEQGLFEGPTRSDFCWLPQTWHGHGNVQISGTEDTRWRLTVYNQ